MNHYAEEPPLTEELIVQCLFMTGVAIESIDGVIRMVAWVSLPILDGETIERRIVGRFAMPANVAWKLREDIGKFLKPNQK